MSNEQGNRRATKLHPGDGGKRVFCDRQHAAADLRRREALRGGFLGVHGTKGLVERLRNCFFSRGHRADVLVVFALRLDDDGQWEAQWQPIGAVDCPIMHESDLHPEVKEVISHVMSEKPGVLDDLGGLLNRRVVDAVGSFIDTTFDRIVPRKG